MNCRKAALGPSGNLGSMLSSRLGNGAVLSVALAEGEVGGDVGARAAAEEVRPHSARQRIVAIAAAQAVVAGASLQNVVVVAAVERVVAVAAAERVGAGPA